jgi:hypothetical protein
MAIRTFDRHAAGLTWVEDERMERASHALAVEGRVWLVDPVDEPEAIAEATRLGEPAGVIQLIDRHGRDGKKIADQLAVPLIIVPDELPGTPLRVVPLMRRARWREVALWWEEPRVLVVPEAIGTNLASTVGTGAAGVHPALRIVGAPNVLRGYAPEHLLVGHGPALHGPETTAALDHALDRARGDIPRFLATLPRLVSG